MGKKSKQASKKETNFILLQEEVVLREGAGLGAGAVEVSAWIYHYIAEEFNSILQQVVPEGVVAGSKVDVVVEVDLLPEVGVVGSRPEVVGAEGEALEADDNIGVWISEHTSTLLTLKWLLKDMT